MSPADGPEERTAAFEESYERDLHDLDVELMLVDDAEAALIDSVEADHNLEVSFERGNMSVQS
jgi:hypothetical protein